MKKIICAITLAFWLNPSFAALNGVSSVNSGVAGSGRSSIETSAIPFLNPAGLAFLKGYHFTSSFSTDSMKENSENLSVKGQTLSVGFVDNSKGSAFPGTLGYRQQKSGSFEAQQIRIASARRILRRNTALGAAVVQNQSKVLNDVTSNLNLSIGALHSFNSQWGVAFLGQNLIKDDELNTVDWFQRELGLGLTFHFREKARIQADYIYANDQDSKLSLGVENYMNEWVIVRMGGEQNLTQNKGLYAVGFGFNLPKFLIHYAYQTSEGDSSHGIDLTLPLW